MSFELKRRAFCNFCGINADEIDQIRRQLAEVTAQRDAERAVVDYYASDFVWMREPDSDVARKIQADDCNEVPLYAEFCGGKRAREQQARRVSDETSNIRGGKPSNYEEN